MRSISRIASFILAIMVALTLGCPNRKKEAWEIAPIRQGEIEVVALERASGLRVDRVRFYSHELKEPRFFLALLPDTPKPLDTVVIINHGWSDRPEYLLNNLHLDGAYARLLREQRLNPAILILPDIRFDNSFRTRSESVPFPEYLTLVAEEVSGIVSEHYKIPFDPAKWGIAGFSFGGSVSLDVGRRYSGRFGAVGVVSSFYDEEAAFWPKIAAENGKTDSKGRGKQTVIVPGGVPRLFLACGTDDRFFKTMAKLHQLFQDLGIPHAWSTGRGGHAWSYWSSVLEELLVFSLGKPQNI